jgi:hypothetical protein
LAIPRDKNGVENEFPVSIGTEQDERAGSEFAELAVPTLTAVAVQKRLSKHKRISVLEKLAMPRHDPDRSVEETRPVRRRPRKRPDDV